MELQELMQLQARFDKAHGFPLEFDAERDKFDQVTKDLVGMLGEIGEFANLVKKMTLYLERESVYALDVRAAAEGMKEELADTFIYLARLSMILKIDLQDAVVQKIHFNEKRYKDLSA